MLNNSQDIQEHTSYCPYRKGEVQYSSITITFQAYTAIPIRDRRSQSTLPRPQGVGFYITLKLTVNQDKSAVDRPWKRIFLGYGMTYHRTPKLKVGEKALDRIKAKIREISRKGRGRNLKRVIEEITPILRGWSNYFKLSEVKKPFEELDGWIRRKLRCILWRQWKRPFTRMKKLMQRGLSEARAWRSALNKRGPWWNSGASHMNQAFDTSYFTKLGLLSLLSQFHRFQQST